MFSGHYLCISMVLLTVGSQVCCIHIKECDCEQNVHEIHTRRVWKGVLSVQLAFCSAGSNVACLPARPLRQERVHWDPIGHSSSYTPDRGVSVKFYRDPITHATLCSAAPTTWQASYTLHFIKRITEGHYGISGSFITSSFGLFYYIILLVCLCM